MNPNIKFHFYENQETWVMTWNNLVFGHYSIMGLPIKCGEHYLYYYIYIYEDSSVAFAQSAQQCEMILASAAFKRFVE